MDKLDAVKSVFSASLENLERVANEVSLKSAVETIVDEAFEEATIKSIVEEAVEEILSEMSDEEHE